MVEAVKSIPIISNGDIRTAADAQRMFVRNRLCGCGDRPRRGCAKPVEFFGNWKSWSEQASPTKIVLVSDCVSCTVTIP